jgi:hypothetical protein
MHPHAFKRERVLSLKPQDIHLEPQLHNPVGGQMQAVRRRKRVAVQAGEWLFARFVVLEGDQSVLLAQDLVVLRIV